MLSIRPNRKFLLSLATAWLTITLACAQKAPSSGPHQQDRPMVEEELSGEMSLKADRDELKAMRKDIPAERQRSNDELALSLNVMKQGTESPQMVHDKFTVLMEKHRSSFRQKVQQLRDHYRRDENKRRDEFLDEQKKKRESYLATKRSAEQMREYFNGQDKVRQEFFANERDRRTSFESDISGQSKDFDSYMREKNNEFNEQYRLYSKKFSERPREKKAVTGETAPTPADNRIDKIPSTPLGTAN